MDKSSSHKQLVQEIISLAKEKGLKVHRKFVRFGGGSYDCIGFSGPPGITVESQSLADKIKSATGHNYDQEQKPGSPDLVYHFPTIKDEGW
jgi:hypothetical protein